MCIVCAAYSLTCRFHTFHRLLYLFYSFFAIFCGILVDALPVGPESSELVDRLATNGSADPSFWDTAEDGIARSRDVYGADAAVTHQLASLLVQQSGRAAEAAYALPALEDSAEEAASAAVEAAAAAEEEVG